LPKTGLPPLAIGYLSEMVGHFHRKF